LLCVGILSGAPDADLITSTLTSYLSNVWGD
jgi:hypothetical protein